MKMEQTQCSETLAYKIQTPGTYQKEIIQDSEQGESLKSRKEFILQLQHFRYLPAYEDGTDTVFRNVGI
jgi:hypothetical protein